MPSRLTAQVIAPHRCRMAAACSCLAASSMAWSADAPFADEARAIWQEEAQRFAPAYEVHSALLPSVADASAGAQTSGPARPGSGFNSTQHLEITRWLTPDARGSGGFGLLLGLSAPGPSATAQALATRPMGPASLDLGVRWRSRLDGTHHVDISAWARAPQWSPSQDVLGMIWQTQQPVYGTRVEVQWASSKTRGLVPEFGAIGVQLQGGSRLVLRARKGGPMLYYRARF